AGAPSAGAAPGTTAESGGPTTTASPSTLREVLTDRLSPRRPGVRTLPRPSGPSRDGLRRRRWLPGRVAPGHGQQPVPLARSGRHGHLRPERARSTPPLDLGLERRAEVVDEHGVGRALGRLVAVPERRGQIPLV